MAGIDRPPTHSGTDRPANHRSTALQGTPEPALGTVGFAEMSRAVVAVAADLVTGVQRVMVGPANIRTARDNACDAMLADQARNQARADVTREVAQIVRRTRISAIR